MLLSDKVALITGSARGTGAGIAERFARVARALDVHETRILAELDAAQGSPQDIGGYYMPDRERAAAAMRPSQTLNEIIDGA